MNAGGWIVLVWLGLWGLALCFRRWNRGLIANAKWYEEPYVELNEGKWWEELVLAPFAFLKWIATWGVNAGLAFKQQMK